MPIRVRDAGIHEAPQGRDMPLHRHNVWELAYYRSGSIQTRLGDEVYECRPGFMLLAPPGVLHADYARTAYSLYWIQIETAGDLPWPRTWFDDSDHTFGNLCGSLVREWRGTIVNCEEMLMLLLYQLDILFHRTDEQTSRPNAELLVRKAERMIEEHFTMRLTIGDICQECGVSPSWLRTQFARLRGHSPTAHLQAVRLENALAMIRSSDFTLDTISNLCGYDSVSHLSRYVKRATGTSPGALRSPKARTVGDKSQPV